MEEIKKEEIKKEETKKECPAQEKDRDAGCVVVVHNDVIVSPEMVPGRSRVTAVYRTRATKGGCDGSGLIRFEGDPRDLKEVLPDPAFLNMGAAERAEDGDYQWVWPLVSALAAVAFVTFLVLFLVGGCESKTSSTPSDKQSAAEPEKSPLTVKETKAGVLLIPLDGEPVLLEKPDKGDTGATGTTGPQGPQGEKGDTGDVGLAGPQGPQGEPGADGAPGKDGRNGRNGRNGDPGVAGEPGADGADGADGMDAGPVTIRVIPVVGGQYELED